MNKYQAEIDKFPEEFEIQRKALIQEADEVAILAFENYVSLKRMFEDNSDITESELHKQGGRVWIRYLDENAHRLPKEPQEPTDNRPFNPILMSAPKSIEELIMYGEGLGEKALVSLTEEMPAIGLTKYLLIITKPEEEIQATKACII
ncbi:MAG TPA: hypothetical protein ENN30_01790 [Candidatus Woesearchaeota archaeon]|nr:hypothetical protein [Candidatus Woesearchaeota archaeon]